jgi:hypothetical protein
MDYKVVSPLRSFPALVAIHGVVATNDGSYLATTYLLDLVLQCLEVEDG